MRFLSYLPLVGSLFFAAASCSADLAIRDYTREEMLLQFYNAMAKLSTCVVYNALPQDRNYPDDPDKLDGGIPCKIWCKAQGHKGEAVACGTDLLDPPSGKEYPKDVFGNEWTPGKCHCDDKIAPVITAIIEPVFEGLAKLDTIICGVLLQSISEAISIGFAAVPGAGQAVTAARVATRVAVESAKTLAENALDQDYFFDGWVQLACGFKKIDLDYRNTFDELVNAPDSVGKSSGCKRTDKKCRKLEPKPDRVRIKRAGPRKKTTTKKANPPKTTTTKKVESSTSTKKVDPPVTTTTEQSTTVSTTSTSTTTSSSSESATAVNCESCRSSSAKNVARDARWGAMFMPRAAGVESCVLDTSAGCEVSGLKTRDSPLSERSLTKADPSVTINGETYYIDTGKHKPCAEAQKDSGIDKYYFLEGDAKCGGGMTFGPEKDTGKKRFQNDHVYEKQTLARFFQWLADGDVKPIKLSTKPQSSWVAEVLLEEKGARVFRLRQQTSTPLLGIPAAGATLDDVMAYAIARSDPLNERNNGGGLPLARTVQNFALVEAKVNEHKGTFFREAKPAGIEDTSPGAANQARDWIRNHAGVFHYLRYTHGTTSKKEDVWNKWMRVSNWVDMVLYEFDQQYTWGSHPDEPQRAPEADGTVKTPSLRAFYAHWIDGYLGRIETNAQTWATDAKDRFEKAFGSEAKNSPAAKDWEEKAFGKNGFALKSKMQFPRPHGTVSPSSYGAYGNPDMTLDRNGKPVDVGVPASL
ncbi:hypothetical protein CMUS01_11167 [Colletotrichum musicola]|uniref:Uncharacterized protein n=1 Tax=Colletotrichum musicola TaxID=2175873 RepID=A0A8H6N7H2_9PEZI|nr:hypothetical protein CMUS01_11167 [Colletotrichum musicola]